MIRNSSLSCVAARNDEPGVDSGISTVPLHTVHCANTVPAASEASKGAQLPAHFLEVPSAVPKTTSHIKPDLDILTSKSSQLNVNNSIMYLSLDFMHSSNVLLFVHALICVSG